MNSIMQGHMMKARISNITKYSCFLSRHLSIFTKLSKQDDYNTYGLTPKFLAANVVDPKRYLIHYNKCIVNGHVATLSTVGRKTGMKGDERKSIHKRKTWENNSPAVLLIDDEGKILSISLFKAQRMAKQKDLKIVKVEDSSVSAEKQVYKLLTGKQYYEEEVKSRKTSKSSDSKFQAEKTLTLSGKIATHDLKSKLKNIHKWLSKGHQVRVTLMSGGATKGDMDGIYAVIEREIQSIKGCILQQQETSGGRKFLVNLPKEIVVDKEETKTQDKQNHQPPLQGTVVEDLKVIHEAETSSKS